MIITISLKKPEDDKTLNIMVEERQTIRNTLTELEKADFLLHRKYRYIRSVRNRKRIPAEFTYQEAGEIYKKMIEAKVGEQDSLVIGADTVVVKDGKVLGKPKNREDAFTMLKGLSGSIHEVYTGVSLWMREDGKKVQYSFYECTKVTMYPVTDEELNRYIDTGEPMDKAGAYGIQGKAAAFIKKIEGDYNNVVGLPIARIYQELKQLGIDVYKFS